MEKQSLDPEGTKTGRTSDSPHLSRQKHDTDVVTRTAGRQHAGQDRAAAQGQREAGLTHRFTHSQTIILRLKIVPVAAAAAIYKAHALSLGEVEVPTRHHGPAGPRHRLLGADSCVKMVRASAGQSSASNASQCYRPARAGRVRTGCGGDNGMDGPGQPTDQHRQASVHGSCYEDI